MNNAGDPGDLAVLLPLHTGLEGLARSSRPNNWAANDASIFRK
jgi:hypothetical protein